MTVTVRRFSSRRYNPRVVQGLTVRWWGQVKWSTSWEARWHTDIAGWETADPAGTSGQLPSATPT